MTGDGASDSEVRSGLDTGTCRTRGGTEGVTFGVGGVGEREESEQEDVDGDGGAFGRVVSQRPGTLDGSEVCGWKSEAAKERSSDTMEVASSSRQSFLKGGMESPKDGGRRENFEGCKEE